MPHLVEWKSPEKATRTDTDLCYSLFSLGCAEATNKALHDGYWGEREEGREGEGAKSHGNKNRLRSKTCGLVVQRRFRKNQK